MRSCDYVLYSVSQTDTRSDGRTLAFIEPLWDRVVKLASRADKPSWKSAKANMAELAAQLYLSTDLTPKQSDALYEHYKAEMVKLHQRAEELSHLGGAEPMDETSAVLRNIATEVLDLE